MLADSCHVAHPRCAHLLYTANGDAHVQLGSVQLPGLFSGRLVFALHDNGTVAPGELPSGAVIAHPQAPDPRATSWWAPATTAAVTVIVPDASNSATQWGSVTGANGSDAGRMIVAGNTSALSTGGGLWLSYTEANETEGLPGELYMRTFVVIERASAGGGGTVDTPLGTMVLAADRTFRSACEGHRVHGSHSFWDPRIHVLSPSPSLASSA